MNIHKSVTTARIIAACEESTFGMGNPGICIACGDDADGCEPDAERYTCEGCGEAAVYGTESLLMMAS
jgi:hypothetical protein